MTDVASYHTFFERLTGRAPYDYQVRVAAKLFDGRNVVLRAPTGAGKTWAVLAPFLFEQQDRRPARLIYALPLRTLAQGVYRVACTAAERLGHDVTGRVDGSGRETQPPYVTLQTGEQPDDRFFDRGRIIVTTYDQLLSGLLCGPYGLSNRLHNVNAACIVGALVVFDEFHLMEPHRAFLTAAACLNLFRDLCQSVWMTATATRPLEQLLADALDAVAIPETETEADTLLRSLPTVTTVQREMRVKGEPLSAEAVIAAQRGRSIVLLNTVGRAQAMFEAPRDRLRSQGFDGPIILLHSRFFPEDRRIKEATIQRLFGRGSKGPAVLVATQVIEAGLDISCDDLHSELCPMNALVQRAGRCARFESEEGTVHVYPLPEIDRKAKESEIMTKMVADCSLTDLAGALVTRGRAVGRKSVVEFGWVVGLPEDGAGNPLTTTEQYFHVKYAPEGRQAAAGDETVAGRQAIFHRPASSGVYALIANLDIYRIGLNDITREYVVDDAARRARAVALIQALAATLLKPAGAQRNTQNPHIVACEGVVAVSAASLPAPALSPLNDNYRQQVAEAATVLKTIREDALSVRNFDSLADGVKVLAEAGADLEVPR
jgi:CRISPR-associated helicase Cas3